MPEAGDPGSIHVLIGGSGAVRFGVELERIGRVLEFEQLPARHRSVDVPGLFDTVGLPAEADRYAEVPAAGDDAHLRLGPETTVGQVPTDRLEAIPHILHRTAARWSWHGLWRSDDHVVVLLDAARLSALGARTEREDAR